MKLFETRTIIGKKHPDHKVVVTCLREASGHTKHSFIPPLFRLRMFVLLPQTKRWTKMAMDGFQANTVEESSIEPIAGDMLGDSIYQYSGDPRQLLPVKQ